MTQEHKELLIKDLCARLSYGVVVDYAHNAFDVHKGHYVKNGSKCILTCNLLGVFISPRQNEQGEYIKPYLFPLSSMNEEQKEELHKLWDSNMSAALDCAIIGDELKSGLHQLTAAKKVNEWCYENHFDINGLIPMGLANDVTGLNIY